jgi:hypothetical protein
LEGVSQSDNPSGGAFAVTNNGVITGGVSQADGSGTFALTNNGTINGGVSQTTGTFSVTNSGTITGGISQEEGNVTLTNSGTITGGISQSGGTYALTNSGTITGGISQSAGTFSVTNSGTIAGGLSATGSVLDLTLLPGSAISGQVVPYSDAPNTLTLGGDSGTGTFDLGTLGTQYLYLTSTAITKSGASEWVLSGSNLSQGAANWNVSGGILEVGNQANGATTVLDGSVSVTSGATLAGHGTILGNVGVTSAQVAPGGTVGTLTVQGNYSQDAASALVIEVSPTQASLLHVTGTASLAGSVRLVYDPGIYLSRNYTLVQADGGLSNQTTLTSSGFSGDAALGLASTTDNLELGMVDPEGSNANAFIFSAVRSEALLEGQSANHAVLARLAGLSKEQGSGEADGSAELVGVTPLDLGFGGQASFLNGLTPLLPDALVRNGGWFKAEGDFAKVSDDGPLPGFGAQGGGILLGFDRRFGGLVGGLALGDVHTALSVDDGESATLDTPRAALYGEEVFGRFRLDGTLGYACAIANTNRLLWGGGASTASYSGQEATGALRLSTPLLAFGAAFVPEADLGWTHASMGAFTESGPDALTVAGAAQSADSVKPGLGLTATKAYRAGKTLLVPALEVAWSDELLGTSGEDLSAEAGSFTQAAAEPTLSQWTAGASLAAKLSATLSAQVGYRAILPTGNLFGEEFQLGGRWQF